jgi:hypothetical protein
MKIIDLAAAILLGVANATPTQIESLTEQALSNLEARFASNEHPKTETCTLDNAAVRREWFVFKEQYEQDCS